MIDLYRSLAVFCLVLGGLQSSVAASLAPAAPSMPSRTVSLNEQTIELTLADAVFLGLRDNRSIRSAYLDRIAQKFDLRVAEDRFTPKLVLSSRYLAARNQGDHRRQAEVIPQTTMLGEYGTQLSLAWSNQLTMANTAGRTRNDGATLTIIQPLLRGAGKDVATAPVRLAVLSEKVNRLTLKSTVSDTITRIITGYRELLRAQEQVRIARDALERSRQLLDANRAMIAAGQMAEFDIVQTEADVATQELAIEEAANQLDASRLELLRLLALDLGTRLRAVEVLDARRIEVSAKQALVTARERQPGYLTRLIAGKQAEINLLVARNERLWDVSLIGGATQVRDRVQNDFGPGTTRTWEGYAGIQIDIPIGDLSRRQAEVRARVDVENQELLLAEADQSLAQDVGDGVRDLGTRWRQYEISQRARELSLRKLEIEREKLQSGRSSNFQVLSFEADLRNAENARLNSLIAYLNAQTSLDQTLGTTLESWDIDLND
ncbi:TolC family protein [Pseudomonas capsici]|uniref:TolC family protein n=1 Tax=Pseudomonas capsici TaxID=2810614 RepID=A0ABT3BSD3_9PSED|nr:TolC family protein [Pseudomonas capsici]MBX8475146.1 TolC family protein [Pseudomonas cichorii]MBN6713520.1 TolC family protein [Pseudomonas capsici]MBN6718674.1 TolC family protein [Pseudomonas capsici]MBN6724706.1 TolC family protein [Pseudomonas capsici]MBX8605932.1 TolC family protein [Pseudomonas cichorii]